VAWTPAETTVSFDEANRVIDWYFRRNEQNAAKMF
jgi:hypothetical protein